jgi:hypothetical protein
LFSTRKSTGSRRLVARIAVAGALAVVPLAAVAGPALADTTPAPSATPVDWHDHGGDWFNHGGDHDGGWHHGWDHDGGWHHHGWNPGWGGGWNPGWGGGWNPGWGMPDIDSGSAG